MARGRFAQGLGEGAILAGVAAATLAAAAPAGKADTATPIQHLIVVIGENRSFDNVFATYQPKHGQQVRNLLSQGIVNPDGSPGPNFTAAAQNTALVDQNYEISPSPKAPYELLPAPNTDSAPQSPSQTRPPFSSALIAQFLEDGLDQKDIGLLLTGATGLAPKSIDTRVANAQSLPPGPFQLTPGVPWDAYSGDPSHRFYQMWQQLDCNIAAATKANPSGCQGDLFAWVGVTVGNGGGVNGTPPADDEATGQGGVAMGFYNMQAGDAPYLKSLAQKYTLADNYHQSVMGGSDANAIALGTADVTWFSDGNGNPVAPPPFTIENPDPEPGSNNFYIDDGAVAGVLSNCSDPNQPGVGAIRAYLASLPYTPNPNCDPDTFYMLNNAGPAYLGDGSPNPNPFHLPPSSVPTIGDALNGAGVSWKYYGESYQIYKDNPIDPRALLYCADCNWNQYTASIMSDPNQRAAHLADATSFYSDVAAGTLPSVSFVKPNALNDGHPAFSKLDIFEAYVRRIVESLQANTDLWASTALLITFDEGGGFYDSGYVQPLDFFGDGTRVPLLAVSPFSRGGRVVHDYTDHASIAKFIEANWGLPPLSGRSRDNLPNPATRKNNPYVPTNSPAIGDLMSLFKF